ncbi:asparagine synthase [Streptomyces sp. NPDC047000]|uniref:asparagine synthase n=1 Tax=Streptomyces sp. NPDC047000 TaxID=3155474 RepID=UPI00340898F3
MLSMHLRLADLDDPKWVAQEGRWTTGGSWIEPVKVSTLVTEINDDRAPYVTMRVKECTGDEADFVELAMRPGELRVSVGAFGTAPLYLFERSAELHASWDMTALRSFSEPERLLPHIVARTLTRRHRYTADTLFDGMHRLTERASATFTASGLTVHYPDPAEHVLEPRELRPGVDPLAALDELLTDVICRAPTVTGCVGVELSGGADSGNVALAVRKARFTEVHSFGLLVGGRTGRQQCERRRAFVEYCGFQDNAVPALRYAPFCPGGVRAVRRPHDPAGAFYQEAFDVVRERAAALRCEVVFTGSGGDEINAHHSRTLSELPEQGTVPWLGAKAVRALVDVNENLAPIPVLPLPTLMAFGMHNPGYLRAGIWPVSPLAHPRVVRFMEQLPHEHKRGKSLFRERIRQAGLPERVAAPTEPENFLAVLEKGLRSYGLAVLDSMVKESILVDLGYVDGKALAQARRDADTAPAVPDLLCDLLALEVGLRSLM